MPRSALLGLVAAATFLPSVVATCALQGSRCVCIDTDGDEWDMTALKGDHIVAGPGSSIWTFEYHFNFCENAAPPPPNCAFASSHAYRFEDYTGPSPICLNLGQDSASNPELEVTKINGAAANGVIIKFAQPTPNLGSFQVTLQCDGQARGVATQPEAPVYAVEATTVWQTFYSCPQHQGGAAAWGFTFLILLSVSAVLYVGGGFGYNYKTKEGQVSHPHQHHWAYARDEGPGLISDGIHYSRYELSSRFGFLGFLRPSADDIKRKGERDSLLAPGDGETSAVGRTSSKSSKKDKREKSSKSSRSSKKSSKGKKEEVKEAPKKRESNTVAGITGIETDRQRRDREVREIASVDERVTDIEMAEGTVKE